MAETKTKLTVPDLIKKKQNGERVVMVAAADFDGAMGRALWDRFYWNWDSLGMTLYGHSTTLPMTVDTMIEHTKAVRRGAQYSYNNCHAIWFLCHARNSRKERPENDEGRRC